LISFKGFVGAKGIKARGIDEFSKYETASAGVSNRLSGSDLKKLRS